MDSSPHNISWFGDLSHGDVIPCHANYSCNPLVCLVQVAGPIFQSVHNLFVDTLLMQRSSNFCSLERIPLKPDGLSDLASGRDAPASAQSDAKDIISWQALAHAGHGEIDAVCRGRQSAGANPQTTFAHVRAGAESSVGFLL